MTDDAIPQWALDEAVRQLNGGRHPLYNCEMNPKQVLARMIAKHEQPPVDPDEEAVMRIISCVLMFAKKDKFFRAALAQYKKEIGRG